MHMYALFALTANVQTVLGATIEGSVTDALGKPLENSRIDHVGKGPVVNTGDPTVKPAPGEVRTDSAGHFKVSTDVPAFVVRKAGYESQRVRVSGDAHLKIELQRIKTTSRCELSSPPTFKTKESNDIDYVATWFYIKTKDGPRGIISGTGPMYSWGAPSDSDVWNSFEYSEFSYDSGVIDAAGHSEDGEYWRFRGIFGTAAHYTKQTRENARQLDCVMDRVPIQTR